MPETPKKKNDGKNSKKVRTSSPPTTAAAGPSTNTNPQPTTIPGVPGTVMNDGNASINPTLNNPNRPRQLLDGGIQFVGNTASTGAQIIGSTAMGGAQFIGSTASSGAQFIGNTAVQTQDFLGNLGDSAVSGKADLFRRRRGPVLGEVKISAPKTLIITLESKMEDKMEAYGHALRRRVTNIDDNSEAIDIISKQIHDLGELEWMLDEESKILLRKHVIFWKSALSMPRRKMTKNMTNIPLSGTRFFQRPLSKCTRCCRKCGYICSAAKRREMVEDCLTQESLLDFQAIEDNVKKTPSVNSVTIKAHLRRAPVFDPTLPAHALFLK